MHMQTAAENDLASELHWRIAALEALHAFVVGPCSQASPSQAPTLTSASAALLQPTLDAICASPALQVTAMQLSCPACSQQAHFWSASPNTCRMSCLFTRKAFHTFHVSLCVPRRAVGHPSVVQTNQPKSVRQQQQVTASLRFPCQHVGSYVAVNLIAYYTWDELVAKQ